MRVRVHGKVLIAALVGIGVCASAMGQQAAPRAGRPELTRFSDELKDLYAQVAGAVVRVSVIQSPAAVLHGTLKSEFDEWVKSAPAGAGRGGQGGGTGGRGAGSRGGGGSTGRGGDERGRGGGNAGAGGSRGDGPRSGGSGGGPGGPRGGGGSSAALSGQVADFLLFKAAEVEKTDPATAAQRRGLAFKVGLNRNGFQGEMAALLVDANGHALLPVGLIREAHTPVDPPIRVALGDGTVTTAAFVGSNLFDGYTVVKLEKLPVGASPIKLAAVRVVPGQFLVSFPAGQGAPAFVMASPRSGLGQADERFTISGDERTGTFVVNVDGELVALLSGGGAGFAGERQALPGTRVQRGIDYIIREGKDVEPRPLGLTYERLDKVPKERSEAVMAALKGRRGVFVSSVTPGSLAEVSGVKVGDVVLSINGRSLQELLSADSFRPLPGLIQLQADLATRTGGVTVGVIRQENGSEVEKALTATK